MEDDPALAWPANFFFLMMSPSLEGGLLGLGYAGKSVEGGFCVLSARDVINTVACSRR
jgi:hypothetical protein